ncbi:MAG TPA: hypothetical protein VM073_02085 [Usitatibacter sp.]|nr:hypothetical protein [Usitatibacter sp.]
MTEIEHDSGRTVPTSTAHALYLMHAISPFTLWSLSLLAVIIGAFARDAVRGTWVESHYSYLLRTFLWGILWLVITTVVFTITVIGIFLLFIPWFILTVWYLYRVLRGWMRLNDSKPAPE